MDGSLNIPFTSEEVYKVKEGTYESIKTDERERRGGIYRKYPKMTAFLVENNKTFTYNQAIIYAWVNIRGDRGQRFNIYMREIVTFSLLYIYISK